MEGSQPGARGPRDAVKLGEKVRAGRSVLERTRAQLERAGAAGLDQLRRTGSRVADAVGTAADRLKESPAAERLGGEVEVRRAIWRATEAESQGDFAAAFALLEDEIARHPDEPRLARAYWRAAVACERPADACDPLLRAIRLLASRGEVAEAATHWGEVMAHVPEARADAGTLLRIVPVLLERDADLARTALRHAVEPDTQGMTPGLAVRVAETARAIDPPTALRAAERALGAPDLHETRRARLHGLVVELGRELANTERDRAQKSPGPDEVVGGLAPLHLRPPDLRERTRPLAASAHAEPEAYEDFSDLFDEEAL